MNLTLTLTLFIASLKLNLSPQVEGEGRIWKFMGIYAKNREEWALTAIANFKNSVTTIALYDTLGPQAIEFVFRQTEMTSVSCAGSYVAGLIKLKKEGKSHNLQNIVSFERPSQDELDQAKEVGLNLYYFQDLVEQGKQIENVSFEEPVPSTVYVFSYTSGTTGDPKAVILTHNNLVSASAGTLVCVEGIDETHRYVSYLPLAHSLEQAIFVTCMAKGVSIGYYSGDPLKLMDDLQVLKPTMFPSVPRLFTRIYDKIMAGVKAQSPAKQWLFNRALQSKLYYL